MNERETEQKREQENESALDRRTFLGTAAVAGAVLAACGGGDAAEEAIQLGDKMTPGPKVAPDGDPIRAGVIGCGGRGTGAAMNFLDSGPSLEIVALADVFEDRVQNCRQQLMDEKGAEVPEEMCFVGMDAYQQVLERDDINYIILAAPPYFRPQQFAAAIQARKHVFMEKPVAVDPVGARSIMDAGDRADAFGLKVATGTQRRHQRAYIETFNRVMDGAIGEIVAARCYWNQGQLWYKEQQEGWSDMEWMIRDWVNWAWLSGDHIVEQHVHNIDAVNWFTNSHPVRAVGMGGRHRRVTGDQYDFFTIDFEMESGVHVMSMCRQIDGCANNVSEFVVGTRGSSNCADTIYDADGNVSWSFSPEEGEEQAQGAYDQGPNSPYVQEHIDLITAIREDQPLNEARQTATSTLVAIMGRISAYTGKETTWDEMMASDLSLGPDTAELGAVDMEQFSVPVPGTVEA